MMWQRRKESHSRPPCFLLVTVTWVNRTRFSFFRSIKKFFFTEVERDRRQCGLVRNSPVTSTPAFQTLNEILASHSQTSFGFKKSFGRVEKESTFVSRWVAGWHVETVSWMVVLMLGMRRSIVVNQIGWSSSIGAVSRWVVVASVTIRCVKM